MAVIAKLKEMKFKGAAKKVEDYIADTLTYMTFPHEHWMKIRSNNAIERLNREIRRRTRVVGSFSDANSALMLVCSRLRYMENSRKRNIIGIFYPYSQSTNLEENLKEGSA